jgi:2-methylcitrate dehydratase PrpD
MQVTRTLARFIADCRPESVPDAMRHQAKRALLNVLGCAVGAARHETVERAVSSLIPFFGTGEAILWGRTERADARHAALLNGISAHVLDFVYKPFACGLVVHAVIDACIQARDEHHLAPEAIARVHARCNPIVFELTANREPRTDLEGKFSVFHAAAAALVHGAALEAQFSDACVLDPTVIALRRRVDAEPDPTVAKMEAYVAIALTDGRRIEHHVPHALGSVERPMADGDIEKKARALGTGVLPAAQIDALVSACRSAEELPDARSLTCHLSRPANGAG